MSLQARVLSFSGQCRHLNWFSQFDIADDTLFLSELIKTSWMGNEMEN